MGKSVWRATHTVAGYSIANCDLWLVEDAAVMMVVIVVVKMQVEMMLMVRWCWV